MSAVMDYHAARHADELAREARDLGYATERAMHKAEGVRQPITYKQWLQQATPPRPSPADELAAAYAAAAESNGEVAVMEQTARQYAALRDAEVAALVALGESYAAIAARLGISKQRVGQYVAAHRARSKR